MNGIAAGDMQWVLEIVLVLLLAGTLFHAIRLERALGVLKRDRAALEALVSEFNASSEAAEQGVERLRDAAEGAGRVIARQIDAGGRLKDDLLFLSDRGEKLADRLDRLVRAARGLDLGAPEPSLGHSRPDLPRPDSPRPDSPRPESSRPESPRFAPPYAGEPERAEWPADERGAAASWATEPRAVEPAEPSGPRVRSQAERDLLRALRLAR